ncbi:hypothetical protein CEXT_90111 [Caerostris extrusa]|uniref:Uncharacterized protein n=1 Tax=Caerostris extrusa TaxID=172846 RepID=A0AAV4UX18_CAEEX|nr:hypothetical protein CEXT_90111 [Caerostris extrusa]
MRKKQWFCSCIVTDDDAADNDVDEDVTNNVSARCIVTDYDVTDTNIDEDVANSGSAAALLLMMMQQIMM